MRILLTVVAFAVLLPQAFGQDDKKEDKKPVVKSSIDVPVFSPEDKKGPAVRPKDGELVDQAILPIVLVKNKLEALPMDGTCYVAVDALKADSKKRCWLHPHALTGAKGTEKVIQVRRDKSGYHISVENVDHQWVADELDMVSTEWIPVKTLKLK